MSLTPKQVRFVEEYLIDLNATQAAIRAGYSANNADVTGPRMLGNVGVLAAIEERQQKRAAKFELTQDWVIERLVENADRAMQAVEVKSSQGVGTGEYKYDGSVANRSLELLGKHIGMFKERVEHTGKDGESLAALSDAEVARRVAFLLASGAQPQDEKSSENADDHRPSTH